LNFTDIEFLDVLSKMDLLIILKDEASNIHILDIMNASVFLFNEGKFVQNGYRERYLESYIKGFILRVNEIRENKNHYEGFVDIKELKNSLKLLNEQEKLILKQRSVESQFFKIYKIISIYATFVMGEPIHPVGTPFPGGFEVKYEDDIYLCPVKDKQKDNPNAVCGFCIAEQDKSV
jgi:uncharacterized protein (UPF0305 family)